jgi:cytosine/adenosine deaminase-related metal-dependent hydrolase
MPEPVDLLVSNADLVVTMDAGVETAGGWVAIDDGLVAAVGPSGTEPAAKGTLHAGGCLVTPGLVNSHHHIFQNLTRSFAAAARSRLFGWLKALYPCWVGINDEAIYLSAFVGLAELALGGCTTTTDHLYIHPRGTADLLGAEIVAARELGFRFHPTFGSMSVSEEEGGLPPKSLCQDEETILAESEAAVAKYHDRSAGAMVRIALAPCAVSSVSPALMTRTAELAERLDVRLHTHLAEDRDEDEYCLEKFGRRPVELFEDLGWMTSRTWVAHCVQPNVDEVRRLGAAKVGVAHCPSSNLMLAAGLAPIAELRAAGCPLGLGCDGSASADSASLWLEARMAMLLARYRSGDASVGAREALEMATLGGAACLGREGELGVLRPGAAGDLVCWDLAGLPFAGALSDPVEALLRCGPVSARHTVVAGRTLVEEGQLVHPDLPDHLRRHRAASARVQGLA